MQFAIHTYILIDIVTLFRPSRVENEYKTYKRLQTLRVKTLRNEGTRENLIRIITMRVAIQFVTQFLPSFTHAVLPMRTTPACNVCKRCAFVHDSPARGQSRLGKSKQGLGASFSECSLERQEGVGFSPERQDSGAAADLDSSSHTETTCINSHDTKAGSIRISYLRTKVKDNQSLRFW